MRLEVIAVLKSSKSFMRSLVADDPVAVFRWSVLRATVRAMFAFRSAVSNQKRLVRAESLDRLLVPNVPLQASSRRGSDTHLNAFLRGEINEEIVPDFCDTSVFKTIVSRARRGPTKQREERQSTVKALQAVKELTGKKPISNKPTSVGRQFEYSLNRLMKTLSLSTPYFIRCIKSNTEKASLSTCYRIKLYRCLTSSTTTSS
jgi:myosin-9